MLEQFKIQYREKLRELEAKKRAELEAALNRREVQDPFTIAGVVITWQAIALSAAVSVAASAASYALSRAFAPKPPKQTIGKLQGTLQLQNSEQGIMIPEIYGAGPAASIVAGSDPTWQNLTNVTGGANGSLTKTSGTDFFNNAGASHNVAVTAGQDAFIRVIRMAGFAGAGFMNTASPTGSGAEYTGLVFGIAWNDLGSTATVINGVKHVFGPTVAGDEFTIEIRANRFHVYRNAAEITSFGAPLPTPSFPLYLGAIIHNIGAGVSNTKVQIGSIGDPPNYAKGGIKVPAIIVWSSGIRKNVNVTQQQVGGKGFMGGQTQTTENITYDIDLRMNYCRGAVNLLRAWANADVLIDQTSTSLLLTGVYDPTTGADADYDPELPPDPTIDYILPIDRQNRTIPYDGFGVGTGSVQGGGSSFAIYPGNTTQEPDPTEESDVDAKHGTGSTTAHRGVSGIVHTNFDLSRWGGIVPNMTAAWEHQTLTNLSLIYASMCERVNVKTANGDYDWSGLATIKPRGMLIAGRLYSPAEVIGSPEIQTVYNYFVTETEGQLVGFIEGAEPTVTIAGTEIGWMDSDADVSDILPEVETIMASEIGLSRQVDVKYIDLDKEWEPNTQSDNRQITEGVSTEVMEVQLALLASEARAAAQRKLYRDYVAGSIHKFTLPWTYLYMFPGYKITVTRAEGFSHVLKLTKFEGGIGVCDCEGVAIEPAAFTQPAVGSIILGNPPPQSIPAMTILTLMDIPSLKDEDEDVLGFYMCGTPRTGVDQNWLGFALHINRLNTWTLISSSNLPGTIGTIISAVGIGTDPSNFDVVGVFTVDLYGTTASLSSVTQADVLADPKLNLAVYGEMAGQFVTATQVAGFPNRWEISVLLNGRRGTAGHMADSFVGKRFVLIDAAVRLVPMQGVDAHNLYSYRAVTSGQSLADAATVDFVWSGGPVKPVPATGVTVYRDRLVADATRAQQIQFSIPRRTFNFGDIVPATKTLARQHWVDVYPSTATANFTADAGTDVLTSAAHGLTVDHTIALSTTGTLPAPLKKEKHYFLRDITTNTFKLAAISGGPAIDITTAGTGTNSFSIRKRKMSARAGVFNPVVMADGSVASTTTPGSGGWLETIQSEYKYRNNVGVTTGSLTDVGGFAFGSITETGYVAEFTLDTVVRDTNSIYTWVSLLGFGIRHYRMRFDLITTGLSSKYSTTSRRWLLTIQESATGSLTPTTVFTETDYEMPDTRFRMQISGSEVRYFRNYSGPGSELIYRSTIPVAYPLGLQAEVKNALTGTSRITNIMVGGRPESVTTYPDTDQTLDFGTQPQTFRFRVYEERIVQGYNYLSDVTDFIT